METVAQLLYFFQKWWKTIALKSIMKVMSLKFLIGAFGGKPMMSKDEAETVKIVYNRFITNEDDSWTAIDDNLEMYGWLNNEEIIAHTKLKIDDHSKGVIRCKSSHDQSICFAPRVLESAQSIIKLYDETGDLHPKNKYLLEYYLVMSEMRLIYTEQVSSAV